MTDVEIAAIASMIWALAGAVGLIAFIMLVFNS
jgi:hypothetical protein